jgi:phage shock protein A
MGITEEMIQAAQEIGSALERTNEGLLAVQDSLQTQQLFARRLDSDANALYEKAKTALAENREPDARKFLLERTDILSKLKEVLRQCSETKQQVLRMEENAKALEQRGMEIDATLRRIMGAKAMVDAASLQDLGLSLSPRDPLLDKFKDRGIL